MDWFLYDIDLRREISETLSCCLQEMIQPKKLLYKLGSKT